LILEKLRKKYDLEESNSSGKDIRVATIMDEFSYNCFKFEGDFYQLGLNNWKSIIDKIKPHFLFVEAAWEGFNKQWTNKISNYSKTSDETLEKIVDYCEINHIPTVFWAKEDPYDFHMFIDAARLFQYVFTTDANMIDKYKEILDHENIHLLPFAAQPKIHNPINKDKDKKGNIVFTGGWYNKFPERCLEMDYLLEAASNYNLTIYDRFYKSKETKNKFPDKYRKFIVDGLDYLEMVEEYKRFKVLLNANSVSDSPSNFSRRVFESLSCGIPVVSTYALGIENYFKDIVKLVNNKEETQLILRALLLNDKDLADRISLK
jgi:spore maturation protein CgeB